MSNPVDPTRTAAVHDPHSSAASDRDETAAMSPSPNALHGPGFGPPTVPGEVGVLGPYRVLKELGKGGMGAVYLALDTRLNRKLALKVMLPEFTANATAKERFLREAQAAAKISHDNVVTVFEADERDGVPYITMQFLHGYPLDDYLKRKGAPPLQHVIRIAREVALGWRRHTRWVWFTGTSSPPTCGSKRPTGA
jgi:serine/threonine protein kinase